MLCQIPKKRLLTAAGEQRECGALPGGVVIFDTLNAVKEGLRDEVLLGLRRVPPKSAIPKEVSAYQSKVLAHLHGGLSASFGLCKMSAKHLRVQVQLLAALALTRHATPPDIPGDAPGVSPGGPS